MINYLKIDGDIMGLCPHCKGAGQSWTVRKHSQKKTNLGQICDRCGRKY